jgi:hypothetical protein
MGQTSDAGRLDAAVTAAEERILAGDRFVRCDLGSLPGADLDVVDRLARLRLDARRNRCRLEIRTTDAELRGLLELAGLDDVILVER